MPHHGEHVLKKIGEAVFLLLGVLVLVAACDGTGHLRTYDAAGDLSPDHVTVDTIGAEDAPTDVEASGPTVAEVIPLPLTDYGPAFWMEVEERDDALLEVVVRARDLTSLVGFATQISWEPALMELVTVTATAPVGGADAVARGVGAGLGPGRLTMGVCRFPKQVDPWDPKALGVDLPGSVEMGRFVLRPIAAGDTVLRFLDGHRVARRPDYSAIPCAWSGLQVRITGAGPSLGEGTR